QSAELDEFIYHEAIVHPAMITHPNPRRVLILGGGEGATLREVLAHRTVEEAVMVDIDEETVMLCEKLLPEWSRGALRDKRTTLVFDDAIKVVGTGNKKFDVVISDLTEPLPDSPSHKLFSVEFFDLIAKRLNSPGVLILQASMTDIHAMELHTIIHATLKKVFPIVRSFRARVPSFDVEWGFVMASKELDPLAMAEKVIEEQIKERVSTELKFYDGETHRYIFSLPKYLRKAIAEQKEYIEDSRMPVGHDTGEIF
ncbi:MAG: spermidine synthase, partial [Firmicutes bacterium]|nr:spermidine synthase [Bacillota bacterium]